MLSALAEPFRLGNDDFFVSSSIGISRFPADAQDVETVLVDGRIVVSEGQVVGVDHEALLDAADHASDSAWQRFAERYGAYEAPWGGVRGT